MNCVIRQERNRQLSLITQQPNVSLRYSTRYVSVNLTPHTQNHCHIVKHIHKNSPFKKYHSKQSQTFIQKYYIFSTVQLKSITKHWTHISRVSYCCFSSANGFKHSSSPTGPARLLWIGAAFLDLSSAQRKITEEHSVKWTTSNSSVRPADEGVMSLTLTLLCSYT